MAARSAKWDHREVRFALESLNGETIQTRGFGGGNGLESGEAPLVTHPTIVRFRRCAAVISGAIEA